MDAKTGPDRSPQRRPPSRRVREPAPGPDQRGGARQHEAMVVHAVLAAALAGVAAVVLLAALSALTSIGTTATVAISAVAAIVSTAIGVAATYLRRRR